MNMGCQKSVLTPSTGTTPTTPRSVTGIAGFADHFLIYRPGTNLITVVGNTGTLASPIYATVWTGTLPTNSVGISMGHAETDPTNDVGGDHLIAYDYESVGNMDDLVYWLPGSGQYGIFTHDCPACATPAVGIPARSTP